MNRLEIQSKLKKGLPILAYDNETITYASEDPIGNAIYKDAFTKKEITKRTGKAHWSDRIVCDICGYSFQRSGRAKHKLTMKHRFFYNVNKKIKKLLID